ncbi:MAG TPA: hypothetical protein VN493_15370 [Thermoanaerobaculia bacterium]|nr:hypothetical protein [Thermoanaerobaculia bacterium]
MANMIPAGPAPHKPSSQQGTRVTVLPKAFQGLCRSFRRVPPFFRERSPKFRETAPFLGRDAPQLGERAAFPARPALAG